MSSVTKATIVTIDDDPILLNTLLSILKPHYEVRPFVSAITALRYLEERPADLILLDCNMPEMTGFELLGILHSDLRLNDIPVIFLTGAEDDGDTEVTALEQGAVDYILKPIKPKVLLTRVRQHLELQRYRRRLETLVEEKTENLSQAYHQLKNREDTTLDMLAKATDMRDHGTGEHIWRTTEFVRIITEDLLENPASGYGLTRKQADDIIKSSKLHDIGKIAIPDLILLKSGKLTHEEFDIIKLHPGQGADLMDEFIPRLGDDAYLNTARDIALGHHEKWNGCGYPKGLEGENTPLSARIVAIADVYDALISSRPYKSAFTHEESVEIIVNDSGKHFDPRLVKSFYRRCGAFLEIASATKEEVAWR